MCGASGPDSGGLFFEHGIFDSGPRDQLADELLIASARVLPAALERSGYRFLHPTLDSALEAALW